MIKSYLKTSPQFICTILLDQKENKILQNVYFARQRKIILHMLFP